MNALSGRLISRMNGIGNEILVLDLRGTPAIVSPADARAIHRAPRLHFDQLMVLRDRKTPGTEAFVLIYNNDGSLSGSCGNGSRCVAYRLMQDGAQDRISIETERGVLECWKLGEHMFRVDMGAPRLGWNEIPLRHEVADTRSFALAGEVRNFPGLPNPAAVSMGNPHAVFFTGNDFSGDFRALGPQIECDAMFPQRANVSFARIAARDHILLNVWERGVGATQACGSAACATLVAAVRAGLSDRRAQITLPGGDLTIEWRESDDHVLMTGPVELEFEMRLDAAVFEGAAP